MGEAKFTPGPWRVAGKHSGYIVYAGSDPEIGSVQIGQVGAYRDKQLLPFNKERWDADCALIAAAPDLYEALRELDGLEVRELSAGVDSVMRPVTYMAYSAYDVQRIVRAALAKACPTPVVATTDNEGGA